MFYIIRHVWLWIPFLGRTALEIEFNIRLIPGYRKNAYIYTHTHTHTHTNVWLRKDKFLFQYNFLTTRAI